jgi:hypothetical protein
VKVGDLVRHRELTYWTGIVIGVDHPPHPRSAHKQFVKFHAKDGTDHWGRMNEYEVISESR